MINDNQVDQIARAIHEKYLAEQTRRGVAMRSNPAMASWDALDDDNRDANRAQARDIERKLATIGCRIGRGRATREFVFAEGELEALARQEQIRWASQHTATGWSHGVRRDARAKLHPCLVSWDDLPEVERDKDRDAVRNIPAVLAVAGLRIVRRRGRST